MLIRVIKPSYLRIFTCARPVRSYCDKKDDDAPKKATSNKKDLKEATPKKDTTEASNRINELLASMSTVSTKNVKITTAKRREKKPKKVEESSDSSDDEKPKNLLDAAKKVAEHMGGDKKVNEMELLAKLLGTPKGRESGKGKETNLKDLISGMQISKDEPIPAPSRTRADVVRQSLRDHEVRQQFNQHYPRERQERRQERRPPRSEMAKEYTKIDLFGSPPLDIFKPSDKPPTEFLETWDYLEKREFRLAATHPPSNYFEKMALWTEQGKLWRFPIDNEQDIGPEKDVDFSEHIFLEEHLEPWCPKRGPVRHFMELVTVGLSKNPYMTVEEKHEHINYYKEYFESKKELLEQLIVDTKEEKAKQVASK